MMPWSTSKHPAAGEEQPAASPTDEPAAGDDLAALRAEVRADWLISGRQDGGVIALSQHDPSAVPMIAGSVAAMRALLAGEDPRAAGGSGG